MTPAQVYALSGAGLRRRHAKRKAATSDPVQFALMTRMPWKG